MIKLIACDLDRTLIPNGDEPNDGGLSSFSKLINSNNFTLAYISRRNIEQYNEARMEFPLPVPDYFFGDVGTVLFKKNGEEMIDDDSWVSYIKETAPNWSWAKIANLTGNPLARLQEDWRQNAYRLSYYIDDLSQGENLANEMRGKLKEALIEADVIYSVDTINKIGRIDILPSIVTKVAAIEFLRNRLGIEKNEVAYCGDSKNDIPPLSFGYKSILVANASAKIKETIEKENKKNKTEENLYIAYGKGPLNGNYASGVIEGLVHFGVLSEDEFKTLTE